MRGTFLGLAFSALAACQQRPALPPPVVVPAQPSEVPVADTESIAGEWRIAGVGGQSIDQPEGIAASIYPGRIHVTAGCINNAWKLQLTNGAALLIRVPVEGCGRGYTETEAAVFAALDGATRAYRRPDSSLVFDGPRGELVLFTQ